VAQGTITRLTYERLGILLTDAPAYKENGTKYTDLIRVQSMDYGFSHQAVDVKAVGSDKLVTRNGQSPIVRAPDVNCNIEYLFAEGQNEIAAGLHIGKDGSVLKNFLQNSSTDDINIITVASHEDGHKDLVFLNDETDFEDYNVIGIGNAFLMNYGYSASVGSLPTSTLGYAGSNMKYDTYSVENRPTLPAVKLGVNNTESSEEFVLNPDQMRDVGHDREGHGYVFDEHFDPEVSTTKPGDIKLTITKNSGGRGGASLDSVDAAVQNISIDLPIARQDIYGMGSNYVFNRKLKLPVIGQLSVDMVLRGYEQDQVDSFLTETDTYDIVVKHPVAQRILGDQGSTYIAGDYYYVAVEKNDWRRIAMASIDRLISEDTDFSDDGNYYYVFIDSVTYWKEEEDLPVGKNVGDIKDGYSRWGKIPLLPTSETFSGNISYSYTFIYVNNAGLWKKFPITELDFDLIDFETSFDVAQNIVFEINRAQLKSQNYTHSIGSDVMVSSSMTFDVTRTDGLRLYFQ